MSTTRTRRAAPRTELERHLDRVAESLGVIRLYAQAKDLHPGWPPHALAVAGGCDTRLRELADALPPMLLARAAVAVDKARSLVRRQAQALADAPRTN